MAGLMLGGGRVTPTQLSLHSNSDNEISFDTLGSDLSLDEAVKRVRDLSKENCSLRSSVEQSNELMKKQCSVLTDWRDKWQQEQLIIRQKHDQAEKMVTTMSQQLHTKDIEIEQLKQQLAQFKKDGSMQDKEVELLTLRQHKIALTEQLESLRSKVESLEELCQTMQNDRDEKCGEIDRYLKLMKEADDKNKKLQSEKDTLETNYMKLLKLKESLETEKKDLLVQNNEMSTQLHTSGSNHSSDSSGFETVEAIQNQPLSDEEFSLLVCQMEKKQEVEKAQEHNQSMSNLVYQLQEERKRVTDLFSSLQLKKEETEILSTKLAEAEEERLKAEERHRKELMECQQEISGLKGRLSSRNSLESHPSVNEDVQRNLKAQVQSLVSELKCANDNATANSDMYIKQKERVQDLEMQVGKLQDDLELQREKDDELMKTLHDSIRHLENELRRSREMEQALRTVSDELRGKLNHTASDFQQHMKLCQQNQGGVNLEQIKKRYEMHIDNLTAQIFTAEEAMSEKIQECKDLAATLEKYKQDTQRLKADLEDMPILRAQVEVYKSDFEAERSAREKVHDEKLELQDELHQLHLRNQELQEELEGMSRTQMAEMHRRHGTLPRPTQSNASPSTIHRPVQAELEYICPKCQHKAPDLDTLQLHCLECID